MSEDGWGPMALSWPAHGALGLLLAVALLACLASALVVALCLAAGRADDDVATSAAAVATGTAAERRTAASASAAPLPDDELARAARTALRARRAWAFDAARQLTGRAGEDLPDAAEARARRGAALALEGGEPIVLPGDDRSALISVPHRGGALVVAAAPTVATRPTTVRLLRDLAAGDAARRAPSIPVDARFTTAARPVAHHR